MYERPSGRVVGHALSEDHSGGRIRIYNLPGHVPVLLLLVVCEYKYVIIVPS